MTPHSFISSNGEPRQPPGDLPLPHFPTLPRPRYVHFPQRAAHSRIFFNRAGHRTVFGMRRTPQHTTLPHQTTPNDTVRHRTTRHGTGRRGRPVSGRTSTTHRRRAYKIDRGHSASGVVATGDCRRTSPIYRRVVYVSRSSSLQRVRRLKMSPPALSPFAVLSALLSVICLSVSPSVFPLSLLPLSLFFFLFLCCFRFCSFPFDLYPLSRLLLLLC